MPSCSDKDCKCKDCRIRKALRSLADGVFADKVKEFLKVLEYQSERTLARPIRSVADFIQRFSPIGGKKDAVTQTEQEFIRRVESVNLIFQLKGKEINTLAPSQGSLGFPDTDPFDERDERSFIFFTVTLKDEHYPRGKYIEFTREINKRFAMPIFVLFRTAGGLFTLAFVHRRRHKRLENRDVVGSVSLIREIDTNAPHRAHIDILRELMLTERLQWMKKNKQTADFGGLFTALLDTLDTDALNRRFYSELYTWYEKAVKDAKFPADKGVKPEEHIIRLITRLLFIWFIKEKGLIAEELFNESQIEDLLKDYDREKGDSYYRVVLQNLFFATLNTTISKRVSSKEKNSTHRVFSRRRYQQQMKSPDDLSKLFNKTPFINGGLFDCLDSEEATRDDGYRIDCFSDNESHYKKLSIPNRLFFDKQDGLISLFNRYKFTVEENTPAEREVALDPELLGKVFENLLAAYNPETRETVRKLTASYYTPRAVVDFMVDEALTAYLMEKASPDDGDRDFWSERLRYLIDYAAASEDARELFHATERCRIVSAIAAVKVLDPAVGSGAFPMGMLHKLTLVLRRLDPKNTLWEGLQKKKAQERAAKAFDTKEKNARENELKEVSRVFERYRDSDFGRKLYLIQNSIFGVDIQPVACQIAKLRFFISLAIEQERSNAVTDNYGIKPLPNLETRFVAADTLSSLPLASFKLGCDIEVLKELKRELDANRERHFNATTRPTKRKCRDKDIELRQKLATELGKSFSEDKPVEIDKIANWDPYDQHITADWFSPDIMFGEADGFDVIIGNPPYRQVPKGKYSDTQFPYAEGKDRGKQNLYKLFVEQSYNLCKDGGTATMIVQSSLMCDLSSAATRKLLLTNTQPKHFIEFPESAKSRDAQLFKSVAQGTCIYQFSKIKPNGEPIRISIGNDTHTISHLRFEEIDREKISNLYRNFHYIPMVRSGGVSVLEKIAANKKIKPLRYFMLDLSQGDLNLATHSREFSNRRSPVQLLRGRNVSRFFINYDGATEYVRVGFMADRMDMNMQKTFLVSQEVMSSTAFRRLHFALTKKSSRKFLWGHSVNKILLKKPAQSVAFLALLNSKFMDWFFRITSTNNHIQGYELEQLPIPEISDGVCNQLGNLAESILKAKAKDSSANTDEQEAEIDRLVYKLYRLTKEEIAVIEGRE